jgi:hypothetical protein
MSGGLTLDVPYSRDPSSQSNLRRKRSKEPKPFTGYIHQPLCEACEHGLDSRPNAPGSPPPVITFTHGRKRTVDTHAHFCPKPNCSYHAWLGRGNIRSNGHPGSHPGGSYNVCRARDISMRPMARCSTAKHRSSRGPRPWKTPVGHSRRRRYLLPKGRLYRSLRTHPGRAAIRNTRPVRWRRRSLRSERYQAASSRFPPFDGQNCWGCEVI